MSRYRVQFNKTALKRLHKLPNKEVGKIINLIKGLSEEPRPSGCKKLKSFKNLWRVRSGNYRVIYSIEDSVLIVVVLEIVDRKDAY